MRESRGFDNEQRVEREGGSEGGIWAAGKAGPTSIWPEEVRECNKESNNNDMPIDASTSIFPQGGAPISKAKGEVRECSTLQRRPA